MIRKFLLEIYFFCTLVGLILMFMKMFLPALVLVSLPIIIITDSLLDQGIVNEVGSLVKRLIKTA